MLTNLTFARRAVHLLLGGGDVPVLPHHGQGRRDLQGGRQAEGPAHGAEAPEAATERTSGTNSITHAVFVTYIANREIFKIIPS